MPEYTGIKAWAEDDRPREKMIAKGRSALSDAELIAILMGSGTREMSAVELARHILASSNHKLSKLARLTVQDLKKFKGVGEAKAISIIAALELGRRRREEAGIEAPRINSSAEIYELMSGTLADLDHEEFWVILLSRSHRLKGKVCVSRGGVSGTVVDMRLVFKPAIEQLASAIILVHNHPSGNLRPSQADIDLTKKAVRSGKLLDIHVYDHLIYTDEGFYSFADQGELN